MQWAAASSTIKKIHCKMTNHNNPYMKPVASKKYRFKTVIGEINNNEDGISL
jgi:hypothetical protein